MRIKQISPNDIQNDISWLEAPIVVTSNVERWLLNETQVKLWAAQNNDHCTIIWNICYYKWNIVRGKCCSSMCSHFVNSCDTYSSIHAIHWTRTSVLLLCQLHRKFHKQAIWRRWWPWTSTRDKLSWIIVLWLSAVSGKFHEICICSFTWQITLFGFKKYFARGAPCQLVDMNFNVKEGLANGSFGRMHSMSFEDDEYYVKDEDGSMMMIEDAQPGSNDILFEFVTVDSNLETSFKILHKTDYLRCVTNIAAWEDIWGPLPVFNQCACWWRWRRQ